VSVRGLLFFVVAIAVGAGVGIGGYWVYDTYFLSPTRALQKAQEKFEKAEAAYANDPAAAGPLYQDVVAQLDRLGERAKPDDLAVNVPAYLLRAKTMWQLGRVTEAREKKEGSSKESKDERLGYYNAALHIYQDMLANYDKDNIDAGSFLLEHFMRADDLGRAELYAEVVARYQLKEDEQPTKEGNARQATAHYLLADRAMRPPNPKPDEALAHLRAIAALPAPKDAGNEKRWRELGLEVRALKMRLDMANKQAAEGGVAPKGVVRENLVDELNATIDVGIAKAQKDLLTTVKGTDVPLLTWLNATNIRGLLDFFTTSIAASTTKAQIVERTDLFLTVCDQLVKVEQPPTATVKALGSHLAELPGVVEKPAVELKKPGLRLLAADWAPLEGRLRAVIGRAEAVRVPVEPDVWLELARKANRERRWADAGESAKKGLELARKLNKGADHASVRNLHREAAWSLFAQNKVTAAEEHLAVVRKEPGLARTAFLIDGLTAVREGRLEIGVKNLLTAQQDPQYARSLRPILGLARAYQGLGMYERALDMLAKLDSAYEKYDQLSDEERTFAAEFFPSADAVVLEAMRCRLALNQIDAALLLAKRLEQRPLAAAARLLLVNHYIAVGRAELSKGNPLDARDAFDAAWKELKAAPDAQRGAPAFVWAEAQLLASQPDRSRPSDAQASVGVPKVGPTNVEKAEQLLKDYVGKRRDFDSHLVWLRWLESRKRLDEANDVLADMVKHFPDRAKEIEACRARLALVRAREGEIGELVAALRRPGEEPSSDVLQLLYLTSQDGGGSRLGTAVGAAIGAQDGAVLLNLWNGTKAQHAGRYEDAARAYGRALSPSRYQAEAQIGLLTSLLAYAAKDSPTSAARVIDVLRADNPTDPVLLLAYAEMARQRDRIQGRDSMENALALLDRVLTPLNRRAVAADLLARGYYAAGRSDLARLEAARAVQLDAAYAPALALAARAATEAEDYQACLGYAEELERALYGTPAAKRTAPVVGAPLSVLDRPQPTLADATYWRAVAADHLGRKDEAKRAYQQLIDKHSALATGYLGLAGLRAQANDFRGALDDVQNWRAKDPKDAAGAAAEVRLLVQCDGKKEAEHAAEAFAGSSPAALVTVARAFADAKAYALAEAWGRRALQAAKNNKADVIAAQLVVGDACRAAGLSQEGDARKAAVDKALTAYKAVWELAPGNPAAGYPLAALQATDPDKAGAAYAVAQDLRKGVYSEQIVSGDRLTVEQLDILGQVYRASKHPGEAVTLLGEAVKQRYKREPRVLLQLALAYRDLNKPRDAMAVLTQAEIAALERADSAPADLKASWQAIADQAKAEMAKLDRKK
jgi:hypothetical protein